MGGGLGGFSDVFRHNMFAGVGTENGSLLLLKRFWHYTFYRLVLLNEGAFMIMTVL